VALSLDTHTILWEISIPSKQPTAHNFVASEGALVYVANDSLLAFNAETGELAWEFTVGLTLQEPIITDKAVYVRDSAHGLRLLDGKKGLYALHPETGQQIGFIELINRPSDEIHAQLNPTISDGILVVPIGTNFIYKETCSNPEKYTLRAWEGFEGSR
jgi:hypothetical protein